MTLRSRTLVYVTSSDCPLCVDGWVLIEKLQREFGLRVVTLDWGSADGTSLVQQAGVLFPPALFLGRRLLGYGRLSERRLRKELARLAA